MKLYLDRIAAYEGTLNAMITVNPDAIGLRTSVCRARFGDIRDRYTAFPSCQGQRPHARHDHHRRSLRSPSPRVRVLLSQKLRDAERHSGKTVLTELANWVAEGMPGTTAPSAVTDESV